MKFKITKKLFGYFILMLLCFSLIVSILFITFGRNQIKNQYSNFLKDRVNIISKSLSDNIDLLENPPSAMTSTPMMGKMYQNKMHMGKRYIKIINDLMVSNVLIFDNKGTDTLGFNIENPPFDINDSFIKDNLNKVFNGETVVFEIRDKKNNFLKQTLIAASPIMDTTGKYKYGVFLVDSHDRKYEIFSSGLKLLGFAILFSILLSTLLSSYFAKKFVMPIISLNNMVDELKKENYEAKSNIKSNDEIEVLSSNLDDLSIRLDYAKRNLDNLEKLRKDFISNLSHELKTPVTILKGNIEALKDGIIDANSVESSYETMDKEVKTLEVLILDLMELTSLQNPSFPIRKENIIVNEVIEDSIRSMRSMARNKNIDLNYKKSQDPFDFVGDYTRIKQLFAILIDNAIKYSKIGASVSVIENKNLIDSTFSVSVINSSNNQLSKEDLDNIFKPFYKKDNTSRGKGLGLSIAHEIAKRHDLKITVDSKIDKTIFTIIFNLK